MQILFAISALCFIGILWAALALARHIKAGRLNNPLTPAHPDFKHHLFAALAPLPPTHSATHLTSASTTRPTTILHQSVRDITAKKQWTLPPQAMHMSRLIPRITEPMEAVLTARKPPRPTRQSPVERLDPAYFTKDTGYLTDPYQPDNLRANDRSTIGSSKSY